jgi:hypothetical protein
MRVLMGVTKDRHNTYYALKTVPSKPKGLRAAVALELKNGKGTQANLKLCVPKTLSGLLT